MYDLYDPYRHFRSLFANIRCKVKRTSAGRIVMVRSIEIYFDFLNVSCLSVEKK
jgi:hypothetical protein